MLLVKEASDEISSPGALALLSAPLSDLALALAPAQVVLRAGFATQKRGCRPAASRPDVDAPSRTACA